MSIEPRFDSIIQQSLRHAIIDNQYIYIDRWSFIHFSSGLIIGLLFAIFYQKKDGWLVALTLLVGYEIIEVFLVGTLFVGETKTDVAWDLIIGMTGFAVSYNILKKKKKDTL